jgi:hypothetical protein
MGQRPVGNRLHRCGTALLLAASCLAVSAPAQADDPEQQQYPREEILRPLTLPGGVGEFWVSLGADYRSGDWSGVGGLGLQAGITDRLQWMLPLAFTYQPVGKARSRLQVAVSGGLAGIGYGRRSGTILDGRASAQLRTRVTSWFAFGHSAFSVISYRARLERDPVFLGHSLELLFQVTGSLVVVSSAGHGRDVIDGGVSPRDIVYARVFAQYNRIFGPVDLALGGTREWHLDNTPHVWIGLAQGSIRF